MPSKPLLSIVVPVNQMSGYLDNLRIWMSKIGKFPWEVLIVHDLGDFETRNELLSIIGECENPRIKFIEDSFGTPGLARNAGLKLATGDWITFWDSDDVPQVDVVNRVLQFTNLGNRIIVASFTKVNEISGIEERFSVGKNSCFDIAVNPGLWRFVFKRNMISNIKFNELKMAEDQIFIAQVFNDNPEYIILDECTYHYFTGSSRHLTRKNSALEDLSSAANKMLDIMYISKNIDFHAIILVKLILTGLKRGSMTCKFRCLYVLGKTIFKAPVKVRKAFVGASLMIAKRILIQ